MPAENLVQAPDSAVDLPRGRRAQSPSPALSLVASLLGFALIMLDASVVNVALPSMGSDLGGGMAGLQWVVDAYTIAFAALLLSTGAFSDRIGATRAYTAGIALFTLASVACGLAPNLPALIGFRVVQGIAAAVVLPTTLALVRQAYADPAQRGRAVSLWAAGGTTAAALGPVAGGALTTAWDWRAIFFINLPVGLIALALTFRAPRSARRPAPLDLPGQLTAVLALAALAFAMIEHGTLALVALGVAVLSLAAFLRIESRHPHPVVPLGLFRNRTVAMAVTAGSALSVAFYGMIFVFSLFFQQVRDQSALAAGLMFLPMTGLLVVVNVLSGRLANRHGPRLPMLTGQLLAVGGLLLLQLVDTDTSLVLTSMLLVPLALGAGLALPPLTAAMMEAVPTDRAGVAAGVLNAARQVSGGLGVAAFGALVATGFEDGLRTSLAISAALLTLTALATTRLARGGPAAPSKDSD
ncbi:MFS transporter [Streptomyces sp. Ncost-T10-10d]|uniref:MFS transporter n=1 Tax=Streptomyces sp. Ncost-T10-10d TaxID=1839774 RepID=UPI00081E28DF|nr:MFS transporter [Streptomyces sp. Ncost-T10-10d]SCF67976.1 MFS transporter, DHA2 family, methylenomycin A resistance protein [Streptomyces sp. Ncost-T10-10d]